MSGITIKSKVRFGRKPKPSDSEVKPDNPRQVCRAARTLALAHHIERVVESGEIQGYAEAARKLGVSRSRLSQVMALLNLPAQVQESLLLGKLHLSERRLRGGDPGGELGETFSFSCRGVQISS